MGCAASTPIGTRDLRLGAPTEAIKWPGARAGERSSAAESKYNVNCGPIAIQDSTLTFNSLRPASDGDREEGVRRGEKV